MTTSLVFSEAIQLLHAIHNNPIPEKLFIRHRSEYDFILSQICLGNHRKTEVSVNSLMNYSTLGSQPTICKRINELEKFQLIRSQKSDDLRIRSFVITEQGLKYLETCFEVFLSAAKVIA